MKGDNLRIKLIFLKSEKAVPLNVAKIWLEVAKLQANKSNTI